MKRADVEAVLLYELFVLKPGWQFTARLLDEMHDFCDSKDDSSDGY